MLNLLRVFVLVCAPSLTAPTFAAQAAQDAVPPVATPQALQVHYSAVVAELTTAETSHLQVGQLLRRHALLRELDAYMRRAEFGRHSGEDRTMLFRDAEGRLCAVGNLMRATGDEALVNRIAATRNEAYLIELTDVPGVAEWLQQAGLSAAEAARIQAPFMRVPSGAFGGGSASGSMSPTTGGGMTPNDGGSGATTPSRGRGGVTSASRNPAGATTGAGGIGRAADGARGAVTGESALEPWWMWWELNKSAYLPPQRMQLTAFEGRRYGASTTGDAHARLVAELQPRLLAGLADGDATVRAAAALTHGRISGAAAVPDLLPLLSDASESVRSAALLALGATGSMQAVHHLLSVAGDGTLEGREISADARPLALIAVGIARRRGAPEPVDAFLAEWARDAGDDSQRAQNVREAALIALDLARSPLATEDADVLLAGKRDGAPLTSRLVEALGRTGDPAHVPALLRETGSRSLERRRAAAVALSGFESPLLSGALMTAFEVEAEPMVRGFLLLSLGEQSGAQARDFLIKALHDGPSEARPWAALALGMHARRDGDESARAVLRAGLEDANEADGYWVLACGLARDGEALAPLSALMAEAANPRMRLFAALSMAMIGGDEAAPALRARLGKETSPLARVGIAQALGVLGHTEDAAALLHEVRTVSSPPLAAQFAAAIGFHGSNQAAAGLSDLLADPQTSATTRAAALDGLALLLDRNEPLLLAQTGTDRNFMALSDWLMTALPTTTL